MRVLGRALLVVARASSDTLSVWAGTRRVGALPRMDLFCWEPQRQRKFGSWLRICDPGDRSQFISAPARFTYGRAILCWERRRKVSGNRRSASIDGGWPLIGERLRGLLFPFTW